jgi:hypothetical protein
MKATVGKLTQTLVNARSLPVPTSTPSARMTSEKYSKKKKATDYMFTVTRYHTTPRFKPCIMMSQRAMPP